MERARVMSVSMVVRGKLEELRVRGAMKTLFDVRIGVSPFALERGNATEGHGG